MTFGSTKESERLTGGTVLPPNGLLVLLFFLVLLVCAGQLLRRILAHWSSGQEELKNLKVFPRSVIPCLRWSSPCCYVTRTTTGLTSFYFSFSFSVDLF